MPAGEDVSCGRSSADWPGNRPTALAVPSNTTLATSACGVEKALADEITRLKKDPPSERELAKVKKGIEAAFVFAQDSLFYQAMLLGQYEIAGDWRGLDAYLPAVRAVTADDVGRVAAVYLDRDNRTVATLLPLSSSASNAPVTGGPDAPVH